MGSRCNIFNAGASIGYLVIASIKKILCKKISNIFEISWPAGQEAICRVSKVNYFTDLDMCSEVFNDHASHVSANLLESICIVSNKLCGTT